MGKGGVGGGVLCRSEALWGNLLPRQDKPPAMSFWIWRLRLNPERASCRSSLQRPFAAFGRAAEPRPACVVCAVWLASPRLSQGRSRSHPRTFERCRNPDGVAFSDRQSQGTDIGGIGELVNPVSCWVGPKTPRCDDLIICRVLDRVRVCLLYNLDSQILPITNRDGS